MIKSISIIYPIYNEQKRLSKTIRDIKKFDKSNNSIKKEYILVNDGSTDNTLSIIKKNFKNNKRVKIINYRIQLLNFNPKTSTHESYCF